MNRLAIGIYGCLSLLSFFLFVSQGFCSLGDDEASIGKDRQALKAKKPEVYSKDKYSIHEIQLPGRIVKEYLSRGGRVFAVTWRGASQPDLAVLLGSYFKEYSN